VETVRVEVAEWFNAASLAIGAGMTALGGIVWSVLKYKRDTQHNHSTDTLQWAQTAFEQMEKLRRFYEEKLADYDKRLKMQEAKCHAEMNSLREENEQHIKILHERIEKLEKSKEELLKDIVVHGGHIRSGDNV